MHCSSWSWSSSYEKYVLDPGMEISKPVVNCIVKKIVLAGCSFFVDILYRETTVNLYFYIDSS
jgi:hypothetical protein